MKRSVLALLVACGGAGGGPDAGPGDPVESSGSVTVMVTERGAPVSGLPVYFHDASGATVFEAVTSAAGASGFDVPGGAVTVLLPRQFYGIDELTTFMAVQEGDILKLELEPLGPRSVEVSVASPSTAFIYTSCGGEEPFGVAGGETTTLTLQCSGAKVDLLALQLDPDTNTPTGSQFRAGVDPGTTVVLDQAFTPVPSVGVSYTNPNGFGFISTTQAIVGPNGRLFDAVLGAEMGSSEPFVIAQPAAPGATLLVASSGFPRPEELDEQVLYTREPFSATLAVDLTPRLPQYSGTERFTGGTLAWSEQPNGTVSANVVRARVRFHRDDIAEDLAWSWQVVAPRGATPALAFPSLPSGSPLSPTDTDTVVVEELTNLSVPGEGYNRVRSYGFADVSAFAPTREGETMIVQRRYRAE